MRATVLGLSLVVVMAAAATTPAEAQLGGMIRRAKEAAEKKAAPEPAASTSNPFADPAVVFITRDQLARFEKALQYEIDQRNALRKSASAGKTKEEYQACTQSVATSAEMMKIIQDMADLNANAPVEQIIKAQQKMQTDMQGLMLKQCGPDPEANRGGQFERLRQIEAEASDIAMPPGFKAPPGAEPNPRVFARPYGMLKERIPVFCGTDKTVSSPMTITVNGEKVTVVKVKQKGSLEYSFRQDEVEALTAGCAGVMARINALFDTDQK